MDYLQNAATTPTSHTIIGDPNGPFHFSADITGTNLNQLSPVPKVSLPNATQFTLNGNSVSMGLATSYSSKSALDAAFPNGSYTINAGGSNMPVPLGSSDAYPTEVPQVTSGTWDGQGRLAINATSGTTLNFNNFSAYATGVGGTISFNLYTVSGTTLGSELVSANSVALNGYPSDPALTSYTIPAGLLQSDKTYYAEVSFARIVNLNIDYLGSLGAFGLATFMKTTGLMISTAVSAVAPAITTQPASQTVTVGANVTLTVVASGNPSPGFQWRKDGVNIGGASFASFSLSNAQLGDAGSYSVVASNGAGVATSDAAVVTVNSVAVAPAITTQPASQTVTVGGSVTFAAAASGSPVPTFQWQKDNVSITGATGAALTLNSVQLSDAGAYTLLATNSVSTATSTPAILTVNAATVAPAIVTQPANQTVLEGNSVTFTVAASGSPAPTFQWKKNGVNIAGATNNSYSIVAVQLGDAGGYTADAVNPAGSTTSNPATLTVTVATFAPGFTVQPLSQATVAGSSVVFSASATGTPAPTLQWRKDGVNLSGATGSDFTITGVTTGDAGNYTVIATNSAGAVSSDVATLAIETPLMVGHDFNGDGKADILLSNTVTGDRAMWFMDGTAIGTNAFAGTVPVEWVISSTGDFDGDGKADIFWTNTLTGDRSVWLMNGNTNTSGAYLGAIPVEWRVGGTGDFDGDGKADVFWTNTITGERSIWLMNGAALSAGASLGVIPMEWVISGTGDFNGDGKSDVLLSNTVTGDRAMWFMNGTTIGTNAFAGTVPVEWTVSGSDDFDGDGKADIFWTNTQTGDRSVWLMNGNTNSAGGYLGAVPVEWVVSATGDYSGDGKADILWTNTSTGERSMWLMNGITTNGGGSLGAVPVEWAIAN